MYGDTMRDRNEQIPVVQCASLRFAIYLDVCPNQSLAFRSKTLRVGDPGFSQEAQDLEHHRGADERRVPRWVQRRETSTTSPPMSCNRSIRAACVGRRG